MTSVQIWKRYESRTRDADISRALRAAVHDPLWLLARQWQWGEFQAHDGGSPIATRVELQSSRPTRFLPGRPEDRDAVRWTSPATDARRAPIGLVSAGSIDILFPADRFFALPVGQAYRLAHWHRTPAGGWLKRMLPQSPGQPLWPATVYPVGDGMAVTAIDRAGRLVTCLLKDGEWSPWRVSAQVSGLRGRPVSAAGDDGRFVYVVDSSGTLVEIDAVSDRRSPRPIGERHRRNLLATSVGGRIHILSRRAGHVWHGRRRHDGSWEEDTLAPNNVPLSAAGAAHSLLLLTRDVDGRLAARRWDDRGWDDLMHLGEPGAHGPRIIPLPGDRWLLARAHRDGGIDVRTPGDRRGWRHLAGPRMGSRFMALAVGGSLHVVGLSMDRTGALVHGVLPLVLPRDIDIDAAPLEEVVEAGADGAGSAWRHERLGYACSLAAPVPSGDGSTLLVADSYRGAGLDWHDFSVETERHLAVRGDTTLECFTLMPTEVAFHGMPAARWWEFENANIDVGAIETAAEDLARLIVMEFALGFGNDWFTIPVPVKAGALIRLTSVKVLDAFGVQHTIPRTSQVRGAGWRWLELALRRDRLRRTSTADHSERPHALVAPTLASTMHGEPVEEVLFARDQMANLAWAVERIVPDEEGAGRNRFEALLTDADAGSGGDDETGSSSAVAALRYRLAEYPPANWIPLVPGRIDGEEEAAGSIELRIGRLLSESGATRTPVGSILLPGGFLHEEEIPRVGVRIRSRYQFTRWLNGQRHVWVSRERLTGRGEAGSGLRFDRVIREGTGDAAS